MQRFHFFLPVLLLASLLTGCAGNVEAQSDEALPSEPPASCPVTVPQEPAFTPPAPYDSLGFEGEFWFGSNSLWTALPIDGIWESLPKNPEGYTQKVF